LQSHIQIKAKQTISITNNQKQFIEKQIKLFQNDVLYAPKLAMLILELNDTNSKIKIAEQNCEICLNNLNLARR
jgi:hypothetical protein